MTIGLPGDVPVPCAWNVERRTDPAVWRPDSGGWYDQTGAWTFLGQPGDVPVPAPWFGGDTCVAAVYRSDGTWPGTPYADPFGLAGDVPVPGDWNGDGTPVRAVWRPSTGEWYVDAPDGPQLLARLGLPDDHPVPADWDGDGRWEPAVWSPSATMLRLADAPPGTVGAADDQAVMLAPASRLAGSEGGTRTRPSAPADESAAGTSGWSRTAVLIGIGLAAGVGVFVRYRRRSGRVERDRPTPQVSSGSIGRWTLLAAAITLPLSTWRVSWATLGDILLALSMLVFIVHDGPRAVAKSILLLPRTVAIGGALALAGGFIGGTVGTPGPTGYVSLVRAAIAVALPLVTLAAARLSEESRRDVALAYACGAGLSVIVGLPRAIDGLRMTGLATHPNHLALTSVLGVALAAGVLATQWSPLAATALVVNTVGVLASGSRSGLLGLAVLGVWLLPRRESRSERGAFGMTLTVAVLAAGATAVLHRPVTTRIFGDPASDAARRFHLEVAVDRIRRAPLTGEGFRFLEEAHSVPIQLWAAGGLLTIVGGGILLAAPIVYRWSDRREPLTHWLIAGWTAFLVSAVVQNIVVNRYLWFVAGLLLAPGAIRAQDRSNDRPDQLDPERERITSAATIGSGAPDLQR
jgi:hypothetical protein